MTKSDPLAYSVILADPPWTFRTWSDKGSGRGPTYPTMTLEELAALPVGELAVEPGKKRGHSRRESLQP